MSAPAKTIEPAVGSCRRVTSRASVDLPQPDSPTRPTVSPRDDVEVDAVDGVHDALAREEVSFGSGKCFTQAATCEERPARRPIDGRGSPRSSGGASGGAQRSAGLRHPAARGAPGASTGEQLGVLRAFLDGERGSAARKRQPDGQARGSGGWPSMVISRRSLGLRIDARHGVQQRPGVGMARIGQQILGRRPPRPPRRRTSRRTRGRYRRSRRGRG